jgi:hypothetical protein
MTHDPAVCPVCVDMRRHAEIDWTAEDLTHLLDTGEPADVAHDPPDWVLALQDAVIQVLAQCLADDCCGDPRIHFGGARQVVASLHAAGYRIVEKRR